VSHRARLGLTVGPLCAGRTGVYSIATLLSRLSLSLSSKGASRLAVKAPGGRGKAFVPIHDMWD